MIVWSNAYHHSAPPTYSQYPVQAPNVSGHFFFFQTNKTTSHGEFSSTKVFGGTTIVRRHTVHHHNLTNAPESIHYYPGPLRRCSAWQTSLEGYCVRLYLLAVETD